MTFESLKATHTCKYQTFESVKTPFTSIKSKKAKKKLLMALESFKVLDTCREVRVIERKYAKGQKKLFELRRFSSYGGSSNREFFMRVY